MPNATSARHNAPARRVGDAPAPSPFDEEHAAGEEPGGIESCRHDHRADDAADQRMR
jgi:hypothetical protein